MPAHPVREVFLGFMRLHILYHARVEPVYGAWLMSELRRRGYDVGPGTLYPTLHALEEAGFLSSRVEAAEGRRRRVYRTTKAGAQMLREGRRSRAGAPGRDRARRGVNRTKSPGEVGW
jgi:PadR family transcriptional regulator PadR